MKIERHNPSDGLAPFVRAFMTIESEDGMVSRLLPDTSLTLAFRYAGTVAYVEEDAHSRLPVSVVSGLRKTTRQLEYAKHSATLVVQFNEAGAASFFRQPLHELFGITLSLDTLIPRRKVDEVEDRLAVAGNPHRRISGIFGHRESDDERRHRHLSVPRQPDRARLAPD
jgi:hypothetical protein